ncbi:MAG: hydroxymethylglutaryl-CoA reductase [Pseudomonadota bacterium]
MTETPPRIPRDKSDDYTAAQAAKRVAFAEGQSGNRLDMVGKGAIDPSTLPGNIENFFGAAQVPMGLAGPLMVEGEHARGPFYVPMATTEGTLVASYNRGMRILAEVGGAKTTVVERYMQRAPVFHFCDARAARDFALWFDKNLDHIRAAAEATTRVGTLHHVQKFQIGPMIYTRFNFETGDAAGQNMSGKAALAACEWIVESYENEVRYTLSGAIDTDKKHSHMNLMHSRGARVVAEAVIPNDIMVRHTGVDVERLFRARLVSTTGALLAGSTNNGMHSANGLTALFIATGQDVANIAESHAATTFVELLPDGDYYWSITIPSLIVATYGGGTGLGTQRECLELLGCYGKDRVRKFIEICAATVLAGEISLAAAVVGGDWVEAHDALGRNRP